MQSCPKNVHTGPLTGASKGSVKNHQSTTPLPPVALALPLEPPGAVGPPSPARGSAGMPAPTSPALATARNPPTQWNDSPPTRSSDTGLLAIGKVFSESLSVDEPEADSIESTLINLTLPKTENVKVEIEETSYIPEVVEMKPARLRRKLLSEARKKSVESVVSETIQIKSQPDVQERLTTSNGEMTTQVSVEPDINSEKQQSSFAANSLINTDVPVVKKQAFKRKVSLNENNKPVSAVKCPKIKKLENSNSKKKSSRNVKLTSSVVEEIVNIIETEKVTNRQSCKLVEKRKSCNNENRVNRASSIQKSEPVDEPTPKKICRSRKSQEKIVSPHNIPKAKKCLRKNATAKGGIKKEVGSARPLSNINPAVVGSKKQQKVNNNMVNNNSNDNPEVSAQCNQVVALKKSQPTLRWSNGWSWEGIPFKSKVFITNDEPLVIRKCFPSMRHTSGDVVCPLDCILLKSGPRKLDLPFVAKVAAMWENPEDGEMMLSLLWYYRPEHTDRGRRPEDNSDEVFASRHKDVNSVACIEDRCYVLTFNEYCRFRKSVKKVEEGLSAPNPLVPPPPKDSVYPRINRQPPETVARDRVFFCRKVYDFRQRRLLKNPS